MEEYWRIYKRMMELKNGKYLRDNVTVYDEWGYMTGSFMPSTGPLTLSITMFTQSIKQLGSEEQKKKWLD